MINDETINKIFKSKIYKEFLKTNKEKKSFQLMCFALNKLKRGKIK
jgi:hypothetical protein